MGLSRKVCEAFSLVAQLPCGELSIAGELSVSKSNAAEQLSEQLVQAPGSHSELCSHSCPLLEPGIPEPGVLELHKRKTSQAS